MGNNINNLEELKNGEKNKDILIAVLLFVIILLCAALIYIQVENSHALDTYIEENNAEENVNTTVDNNTSNVDNNVNIVENKKSEYDIISNLFIDYFKTSQYFESDRNSINDISIKEIVYSGYFKSTGKKLYHIVGNYVCSNSNNCTFAATESSGNPKSFEGNIYVLEQEGVYSIELFTIATSDPGDDFVLVNTKLEK